jgi:hypothetical protein
VDLVVVMTRDEELRRAETHDHARAGERGERLRRISDDVISKLIQHGFLRGDASWARKVTFHVLADHLYGNVAIDVPTELGEP